MRKFKLILCIIALSVMASCMRRPFGESRTTIHLDLKVKTDIVHELKPVEKPEYVKVLFCDPETGDPIYDNIMPSYGGMINPPPGTYDVLVYSLGTYTSIISKENNLFTAEVSTDDIPEFEKSQLSSLLKKRKYILEELDRKRLEEAATKGMVELKKAEESVLENQQERQEELIVNEPDHVFVGRKRNVVIPQVEIGEVFQMTIEMTAETIVETWHVQFTNVTGVQYVTNTVALMSGLHHSTLLWDGRKSDDQVTVYFKMGRGQDKHSLFGTFHTFGKHPDYNNGLCVDVGIMNMSDQNEVYHFDVSDQFNEQNTRHLIVIDEPIEVKPPDNSGGFKPEVDDWEDIETDIII